MTSEELKAIRKGTGLSQQAIANRLEISRKTYNEMENGATIDRRTDMAMQTLARTVRLVSDTFRIEDSNRDTHLVVRSTVRDHDRPPAMFWGHSELMLYGEFKRREHAERWWRALSRSNDPRETRKLTLARMAVSKQEAE